MITSLSKLVELIERESVPAWLREAVVDKKEEIAEALKVSGTYTLVGPNGDRVTIAKEGNYIINFHK
jgi:hypothetical protein